MIRTTKRATAFSTFSYAGSFAKQMRFLAPTYVTEVRRFCGILNRSEQEKDGLATLALELRPLLADRAFASLLRSQGFTTVPLALIEAPTGVDSVTSKPGVRYRPKISSQALMLLKERELLISVYGILEKMAPPRQVAAVRCMIAADCFTTSYALHLLGREVPLGPNGRPKRIKVFTAELRKIMITEAEVLGSKVRAVATDYAERYLRLMISKSYVRAVLSNVTLRRYLSHHHRIRARKLGIAAAR